jgi:hypothetical protein
MISSTTFIRDILSFIKTDLTSNITDPISAQRPTNSKFILTSYPERPVNYPIITIRTINITAPRMGMQTNALNMGFQLEIRIWARNQKEKDELFTLVLNRLRTIQFTAGTGSVDTGLHDFSLLSCVDVDEDGDKPKSKVMEVFYRFVNIS